MDYPIALPNCLVAQPYKLTKQVLVIQFSSIELTFVKGTTRLHNELIAFLKEVTPREDEIQMRNEIIDQISTAIRSLWRGVIVNVFGSFDSNTYLPMR